MVTLAELNRQGTKDQLVLDPPSPSIFGVWILQRW